MAGLCVEGNGRLGSIKWRVFLLASDLLDSQEAMCYVQLVTV